jgi:hypothetical protein
LAWLAVGRLKELPADRARDPARGG